MFANRWPPQKNGAASFKRVLGSTPTQLFKERPQDERIALVPNACLAYAIQLRIPYPDASEFIPFPIVERAIKQTLDVLRDLFPCADHATTTEPPKRHESNQGNDNDDSQHDRAA